MVPGKIEEYNLEALENEIYKILTPILQKSEIEIKRLQGVLEKQEQAFKKTKAVEFQGGIVTTKATLDLIKNNFQNISNLTRKIEELKNSNEEKINKDIEEINKTLQKLKVNHSNYNIAWQISEEENQKLTNAVKNIIAAKKHNMNRSTNNKFEEKKSKYEKTSPLKMFFSKIAKKNSDEKKIDYIDGNRKSR